jgi:dTDP-4-amino-4,6-dideoxygalactose transaminase
MKRIYLSPPHLTGHELDLVRDAFESNWIAPLGPHVDAFEREFVQAIQGTEDGRRTKNHALSDRGRHGQRGPFPGLLHAVALSSGTAALHLALRIIARGQAKGKAKVEMGGRPSDSASTSTSTYSSEVLCSTFTFSASANAIAYEGLTPVFIDCDERSWCMDPELLREELEACAKRGKLPLAVIVVDLYGQSADYDPILAACEEYGVPVIEDAAEALGATYGKAKVKVKAEAKVKVKTKTKTKTNEDFSSSSSTSTSTCSGPSTSSSSSGLPVGNFGRAAAFSFNGNKIITTSGGGMLVSHDKDIIDKARFLATQARDPAPHYQHSEIGFNYRMSNILAAIGRAQLAVLSKRVAARRRNFEFYQQALGNLPGIEFMPEAPYGRSTRWLTCLTVGKDEVKAKVKAKTKPNSTSTSTLIRALEKENIEARPLWKPMHLQPVFKDCRVRGGRVSERLFETGLCLPSGSALTEEDLERVCKVVRQRVR